MQSLEQSLLQLTSFGDFFTEELQAIAHYCSLQSFVAGQVLIQTGDPGNYLGIVLQGKVRVIHQGDVIAFRNKGDVLGEMALIRSEPRIADVVAVTDGQLAVITFEDIETLQQTQPHIAIKLLNILTESTTQKLRETQLHDTTEYIALIADSSQLPQLLDLAAKHQPFLSNQAVATNQNLASALQQEALINVSKTITIHPLFSQDNALGSLILAGNILTLIYLRNPWLAPASQTEFNIVSRFCDNYQVPLATNLATAEILFNYLGS